MFARASVERRDPRLFEPRFGRDFAAVRVHTGAGAAQSARDIKAVAYTVGHDVVFDVGRYAPATRQGQALLAHELAHVVQQAGQSNDYKSSGAARARHAVAQRQPKDPKADPDKPSEPALIKDRPEDTDRIMVAYGDGSLGETEWRALLASAEQAAQKRDEAAANRAYLTLYADVAKLAQATRVVRASAGVNMVTGDEYTCKDAKPGLNFAPRDQDGWGVLATTAFVDEHGKFGVNLNPAGALQPEVAIVLSRSAFKPDKEQTLGILRHEMKHAEIDMEDAAKALRASPKGKTPPAPMGQGASEVLARVEGFMTMFHLTSPAPNDVNHPAFVELLGALSTKDLNAWAEADAATRSEALGRLQEYYCHALDAKHRESFEGLVNYKLAQVRADEALIGGYSTERPSGGALGAKIRLEKVREGDFFRGLQKIIANKCQGLAKTPMKI